MAWIFIEQKHIDGNRCFKNGGKNMREKRIKENKTRFFKIIINIF